MQGSFCWYFHLALSSLLWFAGPDARHHGRYQPEGLLRAHRRQWQLQGQRWFYWLRYTSCVFPLACRHARDVRHHGRYGPEEHVFSWLLSTGTVLGRGYGPDNVNSLEVPLFRSFSSPKVVDIPVFSQRLFPTVQRLLSDQRDSPVR